MYLYRTLLVLSLFAAMLALSYLQHRRRRRAGDPSPWPAVGLRLDAAYWLLGPTASAWISRSLSAGLAVAVGRLAWQNLDALSTGYGIAAALPAWARPIAALACADFANYWLHRAQHGSMLWPLHAIHHSSTQLEWHSALRIHPLDRALMQAGSVCFLLLIGFPLGSLAAAAPVAFMIGVLVHVDTHRDFGQLQYLVATPTFHRWHHALHPDAQGKNFSGIFPLWDLLFGTFYLPHGVVPRNFGISETLPEHMGAQLLHPLLSWMRRKP